MIASGDIVKFVITYDEEVSDRLCRTPSTYGYGFYIQFKPKEDTEYVVCNGNDITGYTVMDKMNPDTPIGFVIRPDSYRISQVGYDWEHVDITTIGKYEGEVPYRTPIGSQVFVVST